MKIIKYILFLFFCLIVINIEVKADICFDKKIEGGYCELAPAYKAKIFGFPFSSRLLYKNNGGFLIQNYYVNAADNKQQMFCIDPNRDAPVDTKKQHVSLRYARPFNIIDTTKSQENMDYDRAIAKAYQLYINEVVFLLNPPQNYTEDRAYNEYRQIINVVMRALTNRFDYSIRKKGEKLEFAYIAKQFETKNGAISQSPRINTTGKHLENFKIAQRWYCEALLTCKDCYSAKYSAKEKATAISNGIKSCKEIIGEKHSSPISFKVTMNTKSEGIKTVYDGDNFTKTIPFVIEGLKKFNKEGYEKTNPHFKINTINIDNENVTFKPLDGLELGPNILPNVKEDKFEFSIELTGDKTKFVDESKVKVTIEYEKYHILDSDNLAVLKVSKSDNYYQRMILMAPTTPQKAILDVDISMPLMCNATVEDGKQIYKFGNAELKPYEYVQKCCNVDPEYLDDEQAISYYLENCELEDYIKLADECREDGSMSESKIKQPSIDRIMSFINKAETNYNSGLYDIDDKKTDFDKVNNYTDNEYLKKIDETVTIDAHKSVNSENDYCNLYTSEELDISYPGTTVANSGQFFVFYPGQQPRVYGEIYGNFHTDIDRWKLDYENAIRKEKEAYTYWQEAGALDDALDKLTSCKRIEPDCPDTCGEDPNEWSCPKPRYAARDPDKTVTHPDENTWFTADDGVDLSKTTNAEIKCGCSNPGTITPDRPKPSTASRYADYREAREDRQRLETFKKQCEVKSNIKDNWKYNLDPDLNFYYIQRVKPENDDELKNSGGVLVEEVPMVISTKKEMEKLDPISQKNILKYWPNFDEDYDSEIHQVASSGAPVNSIIRASYGKCIGAKDFLEGDEEANYCINYEYDTVKDYKVGYTRDLYYRPTIEYYSLVPSGRYITKSERVEGKSDIYVGYVFNVDITNYEGVYDTWFEINNYGHLKNEKSTDESSKNIIKSNIQTSAEKYIEQHDEKFIKAREDVNFQDRLEKNIYLNRCIYDNTEVLYRRDCLECEDPNIDYAFKPQFFYRTVALNNVTPNADRNYGNWETIKGKVADNEIKNKGDKIYNDGAGADENFLEYSFIIDPLIAKEIKEYNRGKELDNAEFSGTESSRAYDDFKLKCLENNGKECTSYFVEYFAEKSGTLDTLEDTRLKKWKYFNNETEKFEVGSLATTFLKGVYPSQTEKLTDWP